MKFHDYYKTLGLDRNASQDDVKKAYRRLAMQWHPDRHPDNQEEAERRFKEVSEAYEVLGDPEKRAKYDRLGADWEQGQEWTPPGGGGFRTMSPEEMEAMFGGTGFSDFFSAMFGEDMARTFRGGTRRHRRFRYRGADVRARLEIPLSLAIRGGEREFRLDTRSTCSLCGGAGTVQGTHICPQCGGVGNVRGEKTVSLHIPPGTRPGRVMRLKGLGDPGGEGGQPGDLYLTVEVAPDERYRLEGDDIHGDLPLAPWEAVLGAGVTVQTPLDCVLLRVPAGCRAGSRLRIRGHGMPREGGGHGDFYARVVLDMPADPGPRARELLEKLAKDAGPPPTGGVRAAESPT